MSRPKAKKPAIRRRPIRPVRRLRLDEGAAIYHEGDPSDALYRVVSGAVRLSPARRRAGVDPTELASGAIFGQADLFSAASRPDSAAAITETIVDVIERADVLALLEHPDKTTRGLFAGVFEQAERPRRHPPENDDDEPADDDIQRVRLLLKPASESLAASIGREPIEITRLPFVVGRSSRDEGEDEDEASPDPIDLVLADDRPYQVSRRHFVIDTDDGELVVRDAGSYHGTTVNRQRIGGDRASSVMALRFGENSIVAGATGSTYRFTLLIETS